MTVVLCRKDRHGRTLWAGVDPSAHHVTGEVRDSRFAARLAPFRSLEEADGALSVAGAVLELQNG